MNQGFIKVSAGTPKVTVADCKRNVDEICKILVEMESQKAKIMVFPELCLTGYTCGDMFFQDILLQEARQGLYKIAEKTKETDGIIFIGLPWKEKGKLYNVVAALSAGEILGLVPKTFLPNYGEFQEARYFTPSKDHEPQNIMTERGEVPFGKKLLFTCSSFPDLRIGVEICEDAWTIQPPGISHVSMGATVLINASASDELVGKRKYRRDLISNHSGRLMCGYVYANAGEGESTTDLVFSGHNMIGENGTILTESKPWATGAIYGVLDVDRIQKERMRKNTFLEKEDREYREVFFSIKEDSDSLERQFYKLPFVPADLKERRNRWEEILDIQAYGLKKRLEHTKSSHAVIGISGGLDSTLALLVAVRAFDLLGLDRKGIVAVTMPCFGTTDRTYLNACTLIRELHTEFREIDIKESVRLHFKDIGHDENVHDVTYENAQARERTQVLMDIANQVGGLVIGTGDMSELALGWATYNGDHMSMYGVNASVPKTLVRYLVEYLAEETQGALQVALRDVLDTPVSPELLPAKDGTMTQVTEDLVGPYELHDFYLYYMLRFGFKPTKIYEMACIAFQGEYEKETILSWLKVFYRRFFSQQFKRSCLPDGPKVGSVGLSPRGDLRMPSDATSRVWLEEVENIII